MQPTLVREPFHRLGGIYEEKYDGWRMIAYKNELSASPADGAGLIPV